MSTSSVAPLACEVCGEVPDITRIDWGCVVCNPDKQRLARQPEIPVTPGDRLGCLQHGKVSCERCGLLETRHRLAFDPHEQDATGAWQRDTRGGGLGVVLLFLLLMLFVACCFWYVFSGWPHP